MKKSLTFTAMFALTFTSMFAQDVARATSTSKNQATPKAHADLINSEGKSVGRAELTQLSKGVEIKVDLHGLPPGEHGFHIHEKGICETPSFKSAGEHFNPEHTQHGLSHPNPHAGDLMNLKVEADGNATGILTDERVTLGKGKDSLLNEQGTALVLHAGPDDQKTPPSGASGGRIACGVIKAD